MSIGNNDREKVGYRRPPKWTQFKRGQSGNSKGRPPGSGRSHDRAEIFWSVALTPFQLSTESGSLKISRLEAMIRKLTGMALDGDQGASRLLHELRKLFPTSDPQSRDLVFSISEDDAKA